MTTFSSMGLAPKIVSALAKKGYERPTPIQEQSIPIVMSGRDLLGIAQTGTGKTAAFALPILHRLAENRVAAPRRGCRALILSPTRELATQIADSFRAYGAQLGFTVATVFGGVKHGPQERALNKGVDILVAAPGRLIDHLTTKAAILSRTEIFVLDEADQMLDMGFIKPIQHIVKHLPEERQNLFFSATMPRDIARLAGKLLNDPEEVSVAPESTTAERVNQQVVFLSLGQKRAMLLELFAQPDFKRVLVFTRTKRGADRVARILGQADIFAAAIHGNKSQSQRENAMASFKAGQTRALVATDIAARGIDVSGVSHVVQFDLPEIPESYVHRIGRTARAGADGSAVAFCSQDERPLLRQIEKTTRQKIPSVDRTDDETLASGSVVAQPRRRDGQRKGGRPSGRSGGHTGRQNAQSRKNDNKRPSRSRNPRMENGEARTSEDRESGAGSKRREHPHRSERSQQAERSNFPRRSKESNRSKNPSDRSDAAQTSEGGDGDWRSKRRSAGRTATPNSEQTKRPTGKSGKRSGGKPNANSPGRPHGKSNSGSRSGGGRKQGTSSGVGQSRPNKHRGKRNRRPEPA